MEHDGTKNLVIWVICDVKLKEKDTRSDGFASSLDFTNTSDFCRNTLDLINNRCKTQTYGSAHAKQWCCLLNFRLPQASDFGWAQNFWEIDPLASLLKKQMRLQADCSQDHYGIFKSYFWFIYRYRYQYIYMIIYKLIAYINIYIYNYLYIYIQYNKSLDNSYLGKSMRTQNMG